MQGDQPVRVGNGCLGDSRCIAWKRCGVRQGAMDIQAAIPVAVVLNGVTAVALRAGGCCQANSQQSTVGNDTLLTDHNTQMRQQATCRLTLLSRHQSLASKPPNSFPAADSTRLPGSTVDWLLPDTAVCCRLVSTRLDSALQSSLHGGELHYGQRFGRQQHECTALVLHFSSLRHHTTCHTKCLLLLTHLLSTCPLRSIA